MFLLTAHRSGGTLLARLFNAHPDIVVWGEHGGLLNKLAEVAAIFDLHEQLSAPLDADALAAFLRDKTGNTAFSPWINPFDRESFIGCCREFMTSSFTRGLSPGQMWGVKEIRYHTAETALFLLDVFPDARFVVLRRDLVQQCLSTLLTSWSLDLLTADGATDSAQEARRVVDDCIYALSVIDSGLSKIAERFSNRTLSIRYEEMVDPDREIARTLYEFAGLPVTPDSLHAAAQMLTARTGATERSNAAGVLTADFICTHAPACVAYAAQLIQMDGPDLARMHSKRGPGRYSFVVGDHGAIASPLSTLF